MNKFTRIDRMETEPKARESRVYGEKVSVGEPLKLQMGNDLRGQIEDSLEQIAKERLLDAEQKARAQMDVILEDARDKARDILEKANAQAKALLQTAQEQEQGIRDNAQESGFKAGFEEGYADATAQVEQETVQLLENARLLVETAYQAEKHVLRDFEAHALELVRHLAKKVLRRELADSPDALLAMVNQACEALYMSGKIRLVLHPQVLHEIRQFSERTAEALAALQRFELTTDPALAPQQIYIIGQDGSFELTPETQVDLLLDSLDGHLALPRPEETGSPELENPPHPNQSVRTSYPYAAEAATAKDPPPGGRELTSPSSGLGSLHSEEEASSLPPGGGGLGWEGEPDADPELPFGEEQP
jgi:flagellar assembly protein FliH